MNNDATSALKPYITIIVLVIMIPGILFSCASSPPSSDPAEIVEPAVSYFSIDRDGKSVPISQGSDGMLAFPDPQGKLPVVLSKKLLDAAFVDGNGKCQTIQGPLEFDVGGGAAKNRTTYDIVMDLTYFSQVKGLETETLNRVGQAEALLQGGTVQGIRLKPGDMVNLRFLGAIDYGFDGKNIPLSDQVTIDFLDERDRKATLNHTKCVENRKLQEVYVKVKQSDIQIAYPNNPSSSYADPDTTDYVPGASIRYLARSEKEVFSIISKEFKTRYEKGSFSRGTYIVEMMNESDLLAIPKGGVKTVFISDGNLQLHGNFKKNYANPQKFDLDGMGDLNPDTYNKDPKLFEKMYDTIIEDPYFSSLKQKCKNSRSLTFLGAKKQANIYFEQYMKRFYAKLLPNCTINFE